MHFRFDPGGERGGGIRLIAEIPDFRICHLEGRNGAGKSLALRLLELISGYQPYAASTGAWSSLRQNLESTTVTIEGLSGKTLRVDLIPQNWTATPEPIGEWLGDAFLDEVPIPVTSVGSLLRVIRIAGDETFERTVQRQLAAEKTTIENALDRFEQSFLEIEHYLDELHTDTAAVDPEQRDQQRLDKTTVKVAEAESRLRNCQEEISFLDEALLARQRLTAIADQLPNIEELTAKIQQRSKEIGEGLRSAKARQASLLADLAGGSKIEQQMQQSRRTRDQRLKRLQRNASEAQRAAAQLSVPLDPEVVSATISDLKVERNQVQSELASAGHNASIRDFTHRVGKDLDEHRELDREVVAVLGIAVDGSRLTARELREGVQRRQIELTEIEDDPLLNELKQRSQELALRITKLGKLAKLMQSLERARELAQDSEADLVAFVGRAEATDALRAEYQSLAAEIASAEEQLRQLLAEEVRLQVQADQLTAGKTREELGEQLSIALSRLNLQDEDTLDERYQAAKSSREEQRDRLRQLRLQQLELQRSLSRQALEIGQTCARLAALTWLPLSVRQALAKSGNSHNVDALVALGKAVESVRGSLSLVRRRFGQLVQAARSLTEEVGRRDRLSSEVPLLAELAEEIGAKLRSEFDQEEVRSALFDGGKLEAIDLGSLEAHWVTVDGERRSRPFEAFSSGEQVFAYTRARIEGVSSIEAKHKVIALDEFGAFLARDRLESLASYLRNLIGSSIADQVIIVVPLAANYSAQAEVTSGRLGERFTRRAEAIASQGYFAEDATKSELV